MMKVYLLTLALLQNHPPEHDGYKILFSCVLFVFVLYCCCNKMQGGGRMTEFLHLLRSR